MIVGITCIVVALSIVAFLAGRWRSEQHVNMRDVLGGVFAIGFLLALAALFTTAIPDTNRDLITYMLGQISGFTSAIVAYHYGQKAGDRELDRARAESTGKLVDAVALAAAPTPVQARGAEQ